MRKPIDHILRFIIGMVCMGLAVVVHAETVEISSLKELAEYGVKSGNTVTMKPGAYKLINLLPLESMPERRRRRQFQFMTFSGSDNTFLLEGVTIEVDTALRSTLRPPIHTDEFLVRGNNNTIKGLTIKHIGDGKSAGGAAFGIAGTGTTLRDCTFLVRGSSPYGYGDLFGKGGLKHSGVHIVGSETRIIGCRIFMRSFGHGFYIQENAANCHFENCYVEGTMRSTDDMLAETSGLAFDRGFRMVWRNRAGENRIMPGYMKSLAEDGFRTYGQHKNLTFRNCTAKNMRGGFELRTKEGARIENCTAIGNERGFWVNSNAVIVNSRGDAQHGPLLFVEGDNISVDLELLPTESNATVHALATIHGSGNKVTIKPWRNEERSRPVPIMLGYTQPGAGEGMSRIGEKAARDVTLRNNTVMPVVIGVQASECEIATRGRVRENKGSEISIREL